MDGHLNYLGHNNPDQASQIVYQFLVFASFTTSSQMLFMNQLIVKYFHDKIIMQGMCQMRG